MSGRVLLSRAILPDGRAADLLIEGGRIARIGVELVAGEAERIDVGRRVVVPGFVDGHIHLDKTLLGTPWRPHEAGDSVAARVAAEKRIRRELGVPIAVRARALAEQVLALGTTAVRTHVDIDTDIGLAGLHAVLEVRAAMVGRLDIQIVAFPQSGILADPGTADLLEQALADGADLIGGLDPASFDGDIEGHLDIVFGLAERRGVGIDIHLHDGGTLGAFELRRIAERSLALGMQGRVAVSHAFALGDIDATEFDRTASALARGGVAIMTTAPGSVPMPPVKKLLAHGVRVFAGSDNIRDAWAPFGTGDMLERAMLIGYCAGFRTDADLHLAFDLVTTAPAAVLGRDARAVAEGATADLVVLDAPSVPEAIAARAGRHLVLKGGQVIR
jgi:cytosine/creatinine deaminase